MEYQTRTPSAWGTNADRLTTSRTGGSGHVFVQLRWGKLCTSSYHNTVVPSTCLGSYSLSSGAVCSISQPASVRGMPWKEINLLCFSQPGGIALLTCVKSMFTPRYNSVRDTRFDAGSMASHQSPGCSRADFCDEHDVVTYNKSLCSVSFTTVYSL